MSEFRAEVHRFDKEGANWDSTELRIKDKELRVLWQVFDHFGRLTPFQMERLHNAAQEAEKYGRGQASIQFRGRGYDIGFTKL